MRNIFTILIVTLLYFDSIAQPSADTLFLKLKDSKPQEKVDIYLAIAKVNWRYSTDSIYKYSTMALDLARKIDYTNGEAKALSYIGVTYFYKASYDSVLLFYNQAIEKFKESNDLGGAAITINNTGVLYKRMGDYTKALNCYNEAMAIQESLGDMKEVGGIFLNIGIIYYAQNNLDEALGYYFKALEKFESINDKVKIAGAYTNIGQVYSDLKQEEKAKEYYHNALILQKESDDLYGIANSLSNIGIINKTMGNYSESESNLKESLELYITMHDQDAIAFIYNHLAELYTFMRQWEKAQDMFAKTIEMMQSIGDNEGLAYAKLDFANLYFQKKDWKNAVKNIEQSIELSMKLHILDILDRSYLLYSKVDSAQGRYSESLAHYKLYSVYKDSIYNEKSSNQIAEMQTKYETAKKEQEINQLQQEKIVRDLKIKNNRIVWLSSLSVIFITFIIILILYRSKQRKHESKLLLKNTMETEDKERKHFAEELHDGIGPLLSTVKMYVNELDEEVTNPSTKSLLNESNKIIDEAICSARNLSHNLMPQNIETDGLIKSLQVFANRVCLQGKPMVAISSGIISTYGKWQQVMIYRIITELINNSMKHAPNCEIKINIQEKDKLLSLIFEDSGEGFNVDKVLQNSNGIGLQNVVSRVKSLNGTVQLISGQGEGFKSIIEIPLANLYDINSN
jgi:signal transduction histidine kinase